MNYFKKNHRPQQDIFLVIRKKSIIYLALAVLVMSTFAFNSIESKTNRTADSNAFIEALLVSKSYTLQIAEAMPANKYTFRPTDSIRSFGEQMAHIAMSSKFLLSMFVNGGPMPSQEDFAASAIMEKEMGASKEACIKALTEAYDMIANTYENMSDEQLAETFVVPFDPTQPSFEKEKAFQFIGEHNAHHRGQALVALRMQGIKSPDYKLY